MILAVFLHEMIIRPKFGLPSLPVVAFYGVALVLFTGIGSKLARAAYGVSKADSAAVEFTSLAFNYGALGVSVYVLSAIQATTAPDWVHWAWIVIIVAVEILLFFAIRRWFPGLAGAHRRVDEAQRKSFELRKSVETDFRRPLMLSE